jgi:deoxyribonuclease-4
MSIAGGYHRAVQAAAALHMEACQIFTKNNNQWRAKPLSEPEIRSFRQAVTDSSVRRLLAHTSYLINLASPDADLQRKSIESFVEEMQRAEALGLDGLVTHPGAAVESSAEEGLTRVVAALDEIHRRCPNYRVRILLETTAGQGSSLGHRFEHLAEILNHVKDPDRLGVCVDTCHVFAAGYPLAPAAEYRKTMQAFDSVVGVNKIEAFHVNDSKKPLGSRVDRHEHIGRGELGLEPFRLVLNDRRFRHLPMILETPKETENGVDMDQVNLEALRKLLSTHASPARRKRVSP